MDRTSRPRRPLRTDPTDLRALNVPASVTRFMFCRRAVRTDSGRGLSMTCNSLLLPLLLLLPPPWDRATARTAELRPGAVTVAGVLVPNRGVRAVDMAAAAFRGCEVVTAAARGAGAAGPARPTRAFNPRRTRAPGPATPMPTQQATPTRVSRPRKRTRTRSSGSAALRTSATSVRSSTMVRSRRSEISRPRASSPSTTPRCRRPIAATASASSRCSA